MLYPVEPTGVETMTPSPKYALKYFSFQKASTCVMEPTFSPTITASLNAILRKISPLFLCKKTSSIKGVSTSNLPAKNSAKNFSHSFIVISVKNPSLPACMPSTKGEISAAFLQSEMIVPSPPSEIKKSHSVASSRTSNPCKFEPSFKFRCLASAFSNKI